MTATEGFASSNAPAVRELALRLLDLVQEEMPGAVESMDSNQTVMRYGIRTKRTDIIVYISTHKDSMNLGFLYGGSLPDPSKLLRGEGKWKRQVKFKVSDEVASPAIQGLVSTAWAQARTR